MIINCLPHRIAETFVNFNDHWNIVCVTCVGSHIPSTIRKTGRFLNLIFDDIDCPFGDFHLANSIDVECALDFCDSSKGRNLLFTCPSGLTSSPALAYVCKCQLTKNPKEAAANIFEERFHPNKHIISLGAKILKDEQVLNCYKQWVDKCKKNRNTNTCS